VTRILWVCTTLTDVGAVPRSEATAPGTAACARTRRIDAQVLAAYDRSFDALAELGVEFVEFAFPARFTELGAINGRIVSAEAYAVLAALVDDNAQRLDQDVRPRVCAGASISSRDYLVGLVRAGADEGFVHCRHARSGRAADADRGDTRPAGSFH
jgi:Asp-tRNA(Asn)/Glu-tRNA(Gln) amidotransferase A subunit family amidase